MHTDLIIVFPNLCFSFIFFNIDAQTLFLKLLCFSFILRRWGCHATGLEHAVNC